MRFTSIASGSSGNSAYVGTDDTHILVDCGVTMKAIDEGLHKLELSLSDIDAIFLTHEHIDHIKALGTISRKYGIPVYSTLETLREAMLNKATGYVDVDLLHPILPDFSVNVGDLDISAFSIYHDAVHPVGYRIETVDGSKKCAVCTDVGHFDDYIIEHLTDLDAMILEANHDLQMLSRGPYPMSLKRRILSDHGHLCNDDSGRLLDKVLNDHISKVYLGHLSLDNNEPELALSTVKREIDGSESDNHSDDFDISVAKRSEVSELVEF